MTKSKPTTRGVITGAAKKVTARMLTDLWAATDDSLDRFRKTRRPGANTWEIEHLRQVRDLLDLLGYALKSNDADTWALVESAWQDLQQPTEDPAPPPMPPQPTEDEVSPSASQPLPKVDDPDLTRSPDLRHQGPPLPFTEPQEPLPVEQLPAPAPEEWEPEQFDYSKSGTAVGISLEDVGPALPFQGAGAEDADATAVDEQDDDDSYDATSIAVPSATATDDDDSFDATSVAVLRPAPTDPALLQKVVGDADETLQLDAPSEQEPSQSPPPAVAPPPSETAPKAERDAPTTEYETLTTLQGHMPPSLAHLHRVSVEQYAYLVAECEAFPDRAQDARDKLGLRDEYEQSVLDEIFNGRFSQDPTARSQWEQLRVSYRAWLQSGQSS